jgi:hypothetical protein
MALTLGGVSFSLELEDLLSELRRRRWTLLRWGPKDAPDLVAALFSWDACTDVLILRNANYATGYRVPTDRDAEVFNPWAVLYQYHNNPLWTLRAMLSLPAPGTPDAPHAMEVPKRPECFIPDNLPKPILIRPLSAYC